MGAIFIFSIIFLIMFGPPIALFLKGSKSKSDKKKMKLYYIIAVVYLIVGFGVCGSILNNL